MEEPKGKGTIPYNYQYFKDGIKKRALSIIHPSCSNKIVDLYTNFEVQILSLLASCKNHSAKQIKLKSN